MIWQHWLVLSAVAGLSAACWGGSYYDETTKKKKNGTSASKLPKNNTDALLKYLNKMKGGTNPAFQGFPIPDNVTEEWQAWLTNYKANKREKAKLTADYYSEGGPGGGIQGWPEQWIGLHKGDKGFPPEEIPPWGYKAKNLGLAPVCYLKADPGKCPSPRPFVMRWGFNAHVQECMEFSFSGCEGNLNNFPTELACYEKCTKPVSGGCDMETDITVGGQGILDDASRKCGHDVIDMVPTVH